MFDPQKIWSSSQLPSLPSAAIRLLDLSRSPSYEFREFVQTVKTDPAMMARILKAANSSFFGFRSEITSVEQAVSLLGAMAVTSLALGFSLSDEAMKTGPMVKHYNSYWIQSLVQAASAEVLSEAYASDLKAECFLAGLLMDIGRLAMLKTMGRDYLPVLTKASDEQRELHEVEQEDLGFNHAEIGAKLAEQLNLPGAVGMGIRHHHGSLPSLLQFDNTRECQLLKVTAAAASLGDYVCGTSKRSAVIRLQALTDRCFQMSKSDLHDLLARTTERAEEVGNLFSVNTSELPSAIELIAEANEHLSHAAMRAEIASAAADSRKQELEQVTDALKEQNEELQDLAFRDSLTDVYNRRFFEEMLSQEVARCQRTGSSIGVIFADVDKFKTYNDTYGHQLGDVVLQTVAESMSGVLRGCDTLARFGGDEFVILVNQATNEGLKKLAERIRAGLEAATITFDDQPISVTVSLGAAIAMPEPDDHRIVEADALLAAADEALYESKCDDKNQFHIRSMNPSGNSAETLITDSE